MPSLNANIARFYFESANLPPEVFQVARFRGVEEISRLFSYELELARDLFDDEVSIGGVTAPAPQGDGAAEE